MTKPIHSISSTASMQSFGNTGATYASPSTGGWSSLSTTKTASFSSIQNEVIQTVTYSPGHTYKAYNPNEAAQTLYTEQPNEPRRTNGRGDVIDGPAVGQVPVGDMLLPLLAMAASYIFVKLFRNHQTSQAL